MTLLSSTWEQQLINKALIHKDESPSATSLSYTIENLARAYTYCSDLTRNHSKTFYLSSALLPPETRKAARALYAFCRISDDLADRASGDRFTKLEAWRNESLNPSPDPDSFVATAWADTRNRHNIPIKYAKQLLDGVSQDLYKTRYASFTELAHYCYGVASTVGLMTMHIIGFESEDAIPYAVKLGVALQLTNILRDVGEDWENGRLYLPKNELALFGLQEKDIANQVMDDRWQEFMQFQIERIHRLYKEATPGIALLDRSGQFAIAASADLYQAILEDIERNDYNVFTYRPHLKGLEKLKRLPGIWWKIPKKSDLK